MYMGLTSNAVFQPVLPVLQGGRPLFLRTTFSLNLYIVRLKAAVRVDFSRFTELLFSASFIIYPMLPVLSVLQPESRRTMRSRRLFRFGAFSEVHSEIHFQQSQNNHLLTGFPRFAFLRDCGGRIIRSADSRVPFRSFTAGIFGKAPRRRLKAVILHRTTIEVGF